VAPAATLLKAVAKVSSKAAGYKPVSQRYVAKHTDMFLPRERSLWIMVVFRVGGYPGNFEQG
jgi:hypothetical protein